MVDRDVYRHLCLCVRVGDDQKLPIVQDARESNDPLGIRRIAEVGLIAAAYAKVLPSEAQWRLPFSQGAEILDGFIKHLIG